MSQNKTKNPNRYKKYPLIIGALMNFGEMTADSVAETVYISHSSAAKSLRLLSDMGLLNNARKNGCVFYSLPSIPCASVLDVSQSKYTLYVLSSDGTCQIKKSYQYDDRYFTDENLSFFLKDCALLLLAGNYNALPLHLIAEDDFIDKYKNVIDSYNPISQVIARYFDLKKSTVSNYRNCIDRGIRHFNVCKDTLILTVRRDRILMGYAGGDSPVSFIPVKSIDTAELIALRDSKMAAASLAYAIGNTVSLLKIKRIIFDCCDEFSNSTFIPVFTSALERFNGEDTQNVTITRSGCSLLLSGAVYTCHKRYLSRIDSFEG